MSLPKGVKVSEYWGEIFGVWSWELIFCMKLWSVSTPFNLLAKILIIYLTLQAIL